MAQVESTPSATSPEDVLSSTVDTTPIASESAANLRYMPGLDVVRGLAITMVLLYHGLDSQDVLMNAQHGPLRFGYLVLGYGALGVHLFFVLSGFLITGILIKGKNDPHYYSHFYTRRLLRILPAYVLMLTVLRLSHWISGRFVLAALLFVANMPRVLGATAEYGPLWSLSVEEQFYIVWPLCVRACSRRALIAVSTALIVLTPILRYGLTLASPPWNDANFKTWDMGDYFGAGALLAILVRTPQSAPYLRRIFWGLLAGAAVSYILVDLLGLRSSPSAQNLTLALSHTPWVLGWSAVTLYASINPSLASQSLTRPLVFLANISYGLYLCHEMIFELALRHLPIGVHGTLTTLILVLLRFVCCTCVAVAFATLSRSTVEAWFLRMKRTVPMRAPAQAGVPLSGA